MLRDYQQKIVDQALKALEDGHIPLIYAPTGAGKTEMAIALSRLIGGVLFVSPSIEIAKQTKQRYLKYGVPCGLIQGKSKEAGNYLVATYQSLVTKKDKPSTILLVLDECHHAESKSYQNLITYYQEQGTKIIGLTATPYLLGTKNHLSNTFTEVISEVDTQQLIDQGHLSDFDYLSVLPASLAKVLKALKIAKGDYTVKGMEDALAVPERVDAVIKEQRNRAAGKSTLVFAVSVKHAEDITEAFDKIGVSVAILTGSTKEEDRASIIKDFREKRLEVLVSVNCLAEGFDAPNAEVGILARPTKSRGLHVQQVGRLLRKDQGKGKALLLDLVGNWYRHGLPNRPFNPDAVLGKVEDVLPPMRACPKCQLVQKISNLFCSGCEYKFPTPLNGLMKKKKTSNTGELQGFQQEIIKEIYSIVKQQKDGGYKPKWGFYRLLDSKYAKAVTIREMATFVKESGMKNGSTYYLWQEWQEKIVNKVEANLTGRRAN